MRKLAACSSCRRLKTRCELLDFQSPVRCHRCRKLKITCSYSGVDQDVFQQLRGEPKRKPTNEMYSIFAGAFQDLQDLSLSPPMDAPQSPRARNIVVSSLPQRVMEWFRWYNGPTIESRHGLDWSSPLDCIARLQPRYSFTKERELFYPQQGTTLEQILPEDQIHHLLQSFQQRYCPWLGFDVLQEAHDPLLGFVCCALAARHLSQDVRVLIAPKLQAVAEEMITAIVSSPNHLFGTSTTIKALFIWSAWTPIAGGEQAPEPCNPHSILSTAINMARDLGIHEAAGRYLEAQKLQAMGEPASRKLLGDLLDKARLWSVLANMDTMHSLRLGKFCHSVHGPGFASVFPVTYTVPTVLDGCQDLRIRIIADLLRVTENALTAKPRSNNSKDLESWFQERRKYLGDIANLQRLLTLFAPLAEFVPCQFNQMRVLARFLQLLNYYDVLYKARKVYETSPRHKENLDNPYWCLEVHSSDPFLVQWMKDGLVVAEEILLWLVQAETEFLTVFPDHCFLWFSFAAVYVIGVKFVGFNALRTVVPSVDCQLLDQAILKLNCAALWSGHPAKSCADFMSAILSLWNNGDFLFLDTDSDEVSVHDFIGRDVMAMFGGDGQ